MTRMEAPRGEAQRNYTRRTGSASDRLRSAWLRLGARRLGPLDSGARAVYMEWQRWRFATLLAADLHSYRTYRRLDGRGRPLRGHRERLRLKPLGGLEVEVRPRTSDAQMLRETFRDNVHRPPAEANARGVRQIVDLGANIGITVADNALRYPQARILGVELDPDNADLARRNTARWAERCTILQGAAWTEDGEIAYVREPGQEFGFHVARTGGRTTQALSMPTILAHVPDGARIDFLKMDVEGVESRLLAPSVPHWMDRVDAIALQVHGEYTIEDCVRDLDALGFSARPDSRRIDFVTAVRVPR